MKRICFFMFITGILLYACDKKENEVPPSVETKSVSLIDLSTVSVTGTVTETGSLPILDYGFVYSTSYYTPTVESGTKVSLGKTPAKGDVNQEIPLTVGYTLRVCMYLTNSKGTVYGTVLEFYIPSPNITSVTPSSGKVGALVEIHGSNFVPNAADNKVRFGSAQAKVVSARANLLTVEVPDCTSSLDYDGRVSIVVTVGTQDAWSSYFTLLPTITGYSPKNGGFETTITITGSGFRGSYYYDRCIYFGNLQTYYTYVDGNTITVDVPAEVNTKEVTMTLSVNGTRTEIGQFTMDAPVIESISPETGIIGLTKLHVSGRNFNSNSNIFKIGNTVVEAPYSYGYNSISKVSRGITQDLALTAGSYDVSIFNGIEWATSPIKVQLAMPEVTSMSPASGYPGSTVTVTGNIFGQMKGSSAYCYLGNGSTVYDGSVVYIKNATVTSVGDQHQISFTVPDMASGTYKVRFVISSEDSNMPALEMFTSMQFTVLPPSITGFTPKSGVAGDIVTITGKNLRNNEVFFGTTKGKITSISPTEIKVQVPSGIEGKMKISIVAYGNTVVSDDDFTVIR